MGVGEIGFGILTGHGFSRAYRNEESRQEREKRRKEIMFSARRLY